MTIKQKIISFWIGCFQWTIGRDDVQKMYNEQIMNNLPETKFTIAIIDNEGIITEICRVSKGQRPDINDLHDSNIYEFDSNMKEQILDEIYENFFVLKTTILTIKPPKP